MTESNQPLGFPVPDWQAPLCPSGETMEGRFCRLEALDPERHAASLQDANLLDPEGRNWTYLPYGPFETLESYRVWMDEYCRGRDPLFYAIIDLSRKRAVGVASYLRIDPANGSIEVGHLNYSPLLQRTPAATEAMFLMMKHGFELGYRRYEWKCNALNAPSRAAAQRLGFSFEGIFRQATVVKGRNRDTAWYAILDQDWPALKAAFLKWLDPSNFDAQGKQRIALSDLTRPIARQYLLAATETTDDKAPRQKDLQSGAMPGSVTELPFNKLLGFEAAEPPCVLRLPGGAQYLNHVGTVHASAQLALAEAASGQFLLDLGGIAREGVAVVRRFQAKFHNPGTGAITARVTLSPEALDRIRCELDRKARALIEVPVENHDESGTRTLSASVEWFVMRSK